MMRPILLAAASLLFAGCSGRAPQTFGTMVESRLVPITAVQQLPIESPVALNGIMTEKCPVAGCWFMLRDESGTIKVDTKNAGFVVVSVPLNSKLTVAGRVMTNGTERFIEADGARY